MAASILSHGMPLTALGASKMKFYNLSRGVGLTVDCYSDDQKCSQKH